MDALKDELAGPPTEPSASRTLELEGEFDPYIAPFSETEFEAALWACGTGSDAGLVQTSNKMLRELLPPARDRLRRIFNYCFAESKFAVSWISALIKFIPKPGGKGHMPISLTSAVGKLIERLVHRRLDHKRLIPSYQFGFRKLRSASDCVSALVVEVSQGMLRRGDDLEECKVSSRIKNFVSHMLSNRVLVFDDPGSHGRSCGVVVPHGWALSPLFNLALLTSPHTSIRRQHTSLYKVR